MCDDHGIGRTKDESKRDYLCTPLPFELLRLL